MRHPRAKVGTATARDHRFLINDTSIQTIVNFADALADTPSSRSRHGELRLLARRAGHSPSSFLGFLVGLALVVGGGGAFVFGTTLAGARRGGAGCGAGCTAGLVGSATGGGGGVSVVVGGSGVGVGVSAGSPGPGALGGRSVTAALVLSETAALPLATIVTPTTAASRARTHWYTAPPESSPA
jgi:hypothetical protein